MPNEDPNPDGGDIIIKGGSVGVFYDSDYYPEDPGNRKKHKNAARKITRIRVENAGEEILFDSGTEPDGLLFQVIVSTESA
jgi:hypothetical protein